MLQTICGSRFFSSVGGLYLDLDVTIRKNPFPLFSGLKFAVGYETDSRIGTSVIFAHSSSEILSEMISFYENGIWDSPLYIGPHIFTELLINNNIFGIEDSKFFPRGYFNPYQGEDIFFTCPDEAYLVHWYQHSWRDAPNMTFLKSKHLSFWKKVYVWQKYFFQVKLRR